MDTPSPEPFVDDGVLQLLNNQHQGKAIAEIKIYPNPSNGLVKIETPEFNSEKEYMLCVFDDQGNLVFGNTIEINDCQLDLRDLSCGVYKVYLYTDEKIYFTKMIRSVQN